MISRREQLLETAVQLFGQNGYHATGIDRIIAESGVAKMTLYKHFKSKEELILAALRRWDEQSRRWLTSEMESRADGPNERLLVLFDVLDEWFQEKYFKGCMFINASAEYADQEDPIHAVAAEHKRLFRRYLHEQVVAAGYPDPDTLTEQIALLMEGAIVTAHISGKEAGRRAKDAARILMNAAA